jgi:hypothetical protein
LLTRVTHASSIPSDIREVLAWAEAVIDDLPHVLSLFVRWIRPQGHGASVAALWSRRWLIPLLFSASRRVESDLRALFLQLIDAMERLLLHEDVHPVQAVVVLLEAGHFLPGEDKVLLPEAVLPIKIVDISLEFSVLHLDVLIEGVLILQVSPQGWDFTVPEVQFILLRILRLAEHMDLLFKSFHLLDSICQFLLQVVDLIVKHLLLGHVSRLKCGS